MSVQVIAEIGVNHDGDLSKAKKLIDVAASAGADFVKFQTFDVRLLASPLAPTARYQRSTTNTKSQFELLSRLSLSRAETESLWNYAQLKGIKFLSTPFDLESASFLVDLGVEALKIGSGELTNLPFLAGLKQLGKPLLLSTGMGSLEEIKVAAHLLRDVDLILFHCTSLYPAPPETLNMRALLTMKQTFGFEIGYSDHSIGSTAAIIAVAYGASWVEKHITLSKADRGPDHRASMEPEEFNHFVNSVKIVNTMLGDGVKSPAPGEYETAAVARRSIVYRKNLDRGHRIELNDIEFLRPATGICASKYESVLGRQTVKPCSAGQLVNWSDLI